MKTANGIRLIIENFYCNFLCFSLFESLSFIAHSLSLSLTDCCFVLGFLHLLTIDSFVAFLRFTEVAYQSIAIYCQLFGEKIFKFQIAIYLKTCKFWTSLFQLNSLNVLIKFLISKIDDDTYTPSTSLIIVTNAELCSRS